MGLLFIALSIFCSLAIAQLLKLAENKRLSIIKVLVFNYLTAFFISLFSSELFTVAFSVEEFDHWIYISVFILGVIFIANMVAYSRSIHRVGMGVSIAAMRMSLIFPIAVSLFVFGESIEWFRYGGILLALAALILMLPKIEKTNIPGIQDAWLPLLIFLMTGMADTGMKVYERLFVHQISENLFLSGIFLISFLVGLAILFRRKELHFSRIEIGYGIVIGIVNLYASVFLIYALKLMPGSVVFPLVNVTLVVLGTIIGIFAWKDQPTNKQWTGLCIAIISIILLL
ncbi:MAG: EamA family transporter [Balneolaceae bacterium]